LQWRHVLAMVQQRQKLSLVGFNGAGSL
jgi:hypothetical protein